MYKILLRPKPQRKYKINKRQKTKNEYRQNVFIQISPDKIDKFDLEDIKKQLQLKLIQ